MKGLVIGLLAASTLTLGIVAAAEHTRAVDAEAKVIQLDKNVDDSVDQWIEAQGEIEGLTSEAQAEIRGWKDAWKGCEAQFRDLYARTHR